MLYYNRERGTDMEMQFLPFLTLNEKVAIHILISLPLSLLAVQVRIAPLNQFLLQQCVSHYNNLL